MVPPFNVKVTEQPACVEASIRSLGITVQGATLEEAGVRLGARVQEMFDILVDGDTGSEPGTVQVDLPLRLDLRVEFRGGKHEMCKTRRGQRKERASEPLQPPHDPVVLMAGRPPRVGSRFSFGFR